MKAETSSDATILIVEDNPTNMGVLFNLLRKAKFRVLTATDGEEGLNHARLATPDLILLDVLMPGIDGFETCRLLKENPVTKDIPVIFMTALSETAEKLKGFDLGAADYITKPFQCDEVLARIRKEITIQEQKKELLKLNTMLSEANATKDKFFSIIAHDLRTPFSALIGATGFLIESFDKLELRIIKDFLMDINASSKEVFALVGNLLEWSRSQIGTLIYAPERINIFEIIKKNILLAEQHARQKKVRLTYTTNESIFADADPNMIDTVVRNLLSNAIKFTHRGGAVNITAYQSDDMIEVFVSDTGIGISEENIGKLFRIDVKLSTRGTDDEGGTGLGLILCKEFIEKNKGHIRVESKHGRGTTFYFTLPKYTEGKT
jgi:signal transduction histidine kinase